MIQYFPQLGWLTISAATLSILPRRTVVPSGDQTKRSNTASQPGSCPERSEAPYHKTKVPRLGSPPMPGSERRPSHQPRCSAPLLAEFLLPCPGRVERRPAAKARGSPKNLEIIQILPKSGGVILECVGVWRVIYRHGSLVFPSKKQHSSSSSSNSNSCFPPLVSVFD